MVDSIGAILWKTAALGIDLMEVIPPRLVNCGEPKKSLRTGQMYRVGYLPNPYSPHSLDLKVTVSNEYTRIDSRSLCKWWFGDNLHTMTHNNIVQAFNLIGPLIGVPIENATVTRLDMAHNLILDYPVKLYLNYLGDLPYKERVRASATGLYYKTNQFEICAYDKTKEMRKHKDPIPTDWQDKHILRLEMRYLENIPRQLGCKKLTVGMLCTPEFYVECVLRWTEWYRRIHKTNDRTLDAAIFATSAGLNEQGIAALAELRGGEVALLEEVGILQKLGAITSRQAFDRRQQIIKACANPLTARSSGLIAELDRKVEEATEELLKASE